MIYKKIQKHFQQSAGVLMMWQKQKNTPPKNGFYCYVFTPPKKAFNITDSCYQCMVSKKLSFTIIDFLFALKNQKSHQIPSVTSGFSLSGFLLLPTPMLHLHKDEKANLRIFAISSKNTSCVRFTCFILPLQTTMFYSKTR